MTTTVHVLPAGWGIALEPGRRNLALQLAGHDWWNETDSNLLAELLTLGPDWDGVLEDLAEGKRDEPGGIQILRLLRFLTDDRMAVFVFQVRGTAGTEYEQLYVSWKRGNYPGVQGLVLIRDGHQFTGFVLLGGDKLATGEAAFGSVGGHLEPALPQNLDSAALTEQIDRLIRQKLNLADLKVESIELLGRMAVDWDMTNSRPGLFLAVISAADAARLSTTEVAHDPHEPMSAPYVFTIDQLGTMLRRVDEGFFLAVIARLAGRAIFEGRLYPGQLLPQI